jgi:ribonucleoside-diphosphate reductase alpha chain
MSSALASFADAADVTPQAILQREARERGGHQALSDQDIFDNGAASRHDGSRSMMDDRTPPQYGIAPDTASRNGLGQSPNGNPQPGSAFPDRGLYHASDAMKSMYDMGDAPSCATCGAIMTRSGSCYRCMSCGNTSGCS